MHDQLARSPRVVIAVAIALGALSGACPGTLSLEEKQHLAYDCPDVPSVIFARRCATAGCHDAQTRAADLDLVSPGVERRLIGVPANGGQGALIDLREPDGSVLLTKLSDRPPYGARMPAGRPALDPAAYACVRSWVHSFLPTDAGVDADTEDGADAAGDTLDQDADAIGDSSDGADGD